MRDQELMQDQELEQSQELELEQEAAVASLTKYLTVTVMTVGMPRVWIQWTVWRGAC